MNKIIYKGQNSVLQKEATAAAAITPGYLVQLGSAAGTIQKHGTAAGFAQKSFALEFDMIGEGIDTDYDTGDNVIYAVCCPGCEVNALVAAECGAIAKGDALISAGDGTLKEAGAVTDTEAQNQVIALALEAVDNSIGTAEVRIKVEIV